MAFSLNKAMLIGHLGRDCETRFSADNSFAISTFSVATSRRYKNKEGAWTDETTWHNIVAYNLSDFYKQNLLKGKKVYVEGRISMRQYNDKDGNKRNSIEIVSENIILLDSREKGAAFGTESVPFQEEQFSGPQSVAESKPDDDLPF